MSIPISQESLEEAFNTFNQLSSQLTDSYRVLEQRIIELNEELTHTHDARLRELTEKERLAKRLQMLLQALPGAIVVLNGDGIVQECNSAALELLGQPLEGEHWSDVIGRVFSPRLDDGHDVSLCNGRKVNISTCPMVDEPGQILLLTDVTEIRRLQAHLNKQERLVAMGKMAASLAHQIRTPLASALLYASNLKRNTLDASQVEKFSGKIIKRLAHLEHVVNDMLLYARSGTSSQSNIINVGRLFEELVQTISVELLNKQIEFDVIDNTHGALFRGNQQMLLSAMINLLNNAIQALHGKGTLKLIAQRTAQDMLEILVHDSGDGIDEDELEHVFEPFYTTRENGTGLGLAVVRAVINAHNGDITVRSQPQVGTTFILKFPIVNSHDTEQPDIGTDVIDMQKYRVS